MSVTVVKGQKADLTKGNPGLRELTVELGWQSASSLEIDTSAFLLGPQGTVAKDEDLIFYNNPSTPYIRYKEMPASGNLKKFEVELDKIPSEINKIAFTLTIYEGDKRKQNFGQVNQAYLRITNGPAGSEILRCDLGNHFSVETAIVVGELYRYNSEWKFNAVAAGFSGGLQSLCENFGIEVRDEPEVRPQQESKPIPKTEPRIQIPSPRPAATPPPPVPIEESRVAPPALNLNLKKIELKKKGDSINLKKSAGGLGEVLINLNWNQKQGGGLFNRSRGVDLDLACLYELKDGRKGVVQALGNAFGSLDQPPYTSLDGDDRTGTVTTGENLRINGVKVAQIERILIFAFIYQGVTNWSEADGVVTIKQSGGPDIIVNLDEHNNRKGMCAIALFRNVNNETFSIERLVQYYSGHKEMDEAYQWGLRWVAGKK
ncbi:TerD family protein [Paenibacillus wynnii]|uniref:Tellurium resistance protein TerA n=1 Tax=Paenibacillus wynnii TaxID=268407 RepID=A0A098MDR2_9BACL|nr:TerD family protein [Paenibacillus wynnii]KGE19702.1 tellurium resistance protein TerA [Paenibacillus wynnii]